MLSVRTRRRPSGRLRGVATPLADSRRKTRSPPRSSPGAPRPPPRPPRPPRRSRDPAAAPPVVAPSRLRARAPRGCSWGHASDAPSGSGRPGPPTQLTARKHRPRARRGHARGAASSAPGTLAARRPRGARGVRGDRGPGRPGGLCLSGGPAKAPEVAADERHPAGSPRGAGAAGTGSARPPLPPGSQRAAGTAGAPRSAAPRTPAPLAPRPWEPQPAVAGPAEPGGACAPGRSGAGSGVPAARPPRSPTNLSPA